MTRESSDSGQSLPMISRRRTLYAAAGGVLGAPLVLATAKAQQSNTRANNIESDFHPYLVEVDGGYEDLRGEDEVTVMVGADGNGGNLAFSPAGIWIDPGTTVIWEWTGEGGQHQIRTEDGPATLTSEQQEEAGSTYQYTFTEAGVTNYRCVPHTSLNMKGAVAVGETVPVTESVQKQDDKLQWAFETDDRVNSSPTVVNETVFFGSNDGNLYVVNATTGELQWARVIGRAIHSAPVVVDGTVFFGSRDNTLYAVDADRGTKLWTFETSGSIFSSPSVVDGTVFVGSADANLYAVDAETGAQQWIFKTSGKILSSPTVVDGTVFVGSSDSNFYAVDMETGEQKWIFETDSGESTILDGTVFIGGDNLYAVDAETGEQEWVFEDIDGIRSPPTAADGTVFVLAYNLHAVSADSGEQQWVSETGSNANSSPTVAGGTVFVGSDDANLYAIDTDSGEQQWIFETGDVIESSPTVADGVVFIGSRDNNLYAVDADVSGSSEDSRVLLGTEGHHDGWPYANQSIDVPMTARFISWGRNQIRNNPTLLIAGIGGIAAGSYLIRRGYSTKQSQGRPSEPTGEDSASDTTEINEQSTTTTNETITNSDSATDRHRTAAEAALEASATARSNDNYGKAADAYSDALSEYQAVLEELGAGATEQRAEIQKAIKSTRANLETVKTRHNQQIELTEDLKQAERSIQEAIIAYAEDNQTVARIRFRQARDALDEAIETISEGDDDLLTPSIELSIDPDRELSSTTLSELPVISEAATTSLANAGIETIDDLGSSEESPWTPPEVVKLADTEPLSDEIVTVLTLLSWWHDDNSCVFDAVEAVKRRQQQANYGFDHTT